MHSSCELTNTRRSASAEFFSAIDKEREPGDRTSEPGMNQIELCYMFYALHQSFSQLNAKLASKCSDLVPPLGLENVSGLWPPASGSRHSLDLISFENDFGGSLEQTEDEGLVVDAADRCCMCLTAASTEELMMTPCCPKAVGSICFEEGLQEDGKCCLCQMHPYKSNLPPSQEPLDDTSDYKVRFIPVTDQEDTSYQAPLETSTIWCAEHSNSFCMGDAVADDPPPLIDLSESPLGNATETQEKQNLLHSPNTEKVEGKPLAPLS